MLLLAGTVVAFVGGLGYLSWTLYSFVSDHISDLTTAISSDWLDFVSYTLNFKVIYSFCTVYYFAFCSLTIGFLTLYALSVVSKFLPAFLALVNRSIKLMTSN